MPTLVADIVTTKEELEAWKKERAEKRQKGGQPVQPPHLDPKKSPRGGWQDDVNLLVEFLLGLKNLMRYLIEHRVPENPSKLFKSCFSDVEDNINAAISDLYTINGENHAAYVDLQVRELTKKPLKLKIRECFRRITSSPVPAVLERFDSILGSIFPVLATLEPIKEFKEALESRIKHDGDKGIISLNIFGNEQLWNKAEAED